MRTVLSRRFGGCGRGVGRCSGSPFAVGTSCGRETVPSVLCRSSIRGRSMGDRHCCRDFGYGGRRAKPPSWRCRVALMVRHCFGSRGSARPESGVCGVTWLASSSSHLREGLLRRVLVGWFPACGRALRGERAVAGWALWFASSSSRLVWLFDETKPCRCCGRTSVQRQRRFDVDGVACCVVVLAVSDSAPGRDGFGLLRPARPSCRAHPSSALGPGRIPWCGAFGRRPEVRSRDVLHTVMVHGDPRIRVWRGRVRWDWPLW
jgi:hypothetical protein